VRVHAPRRIRGAEALAIAIVLAAAAPAAAEPAVVATIVPASDARRAIVLGPSGQVFEPDGSGAWVRRRAGGVASTIDLAARSGDDAIAAGGGALYRWQGGTWTAIFVGRGAKAVVARGPRAVYAIGRAVFALDGKKLADAPAPVVALGAGPSGVVARTRSGTFRRAGATWQRIEVPGDAELASDRWATVGTQVIDLASGHAIGVDFAIAAARAYDDAIVVASSGGDVAIVRGGRVERDRATVDPPGTVVAVTADRDGRVVVALADGRVALRERGAWTIARLRDELPPPHVGSPPAESR
jgi:hypothetical protein